MKSSNIRKWLATGSAVAVAAVFSQQAIAATVTATYNGPQLRDTFSIQAVVPTSPTTSYSTTTSGGGIFKFTRAPGGGAPALVPAPNNPDTYFVGMCMELNEFVSGTHTWDFSQLKDAPNDANFAANQPIGDVKAGHIKLLLGFVLPDFGKTTTADISKADLTALQMAIWEIVHEVKGTAYSISTGLATFASVGASSGVNPTINATAQGWLDNLWNGNLLGWKPAQNIFALTDDGTQDIIVQAVPLPAAAWLLGSGLLGLFGLSRRKKAAATA